MLFRSALTRIAGIARTAALPATALGLLDAIPLDVFAVARMNDLARATITVVDKQAPDQLTFDCQVRHADALLLNGAITVRAPSTQQTVDERDPVDVVLRRNDVFGRLFRECEPLPPVSCAVVHPCDASALRGALEAARHGMITPVLVGPQAKIQAVAQAEGLDLNGHRIVHTEHSHAAAEAAVAMARSGEVQARSEEHTSELQSH